VFFLDLSSVTDVPDLLSTTVLNNTFNNCSSLTVINRSNDWDTSNVQQMDSTFKDCINFNSNISAWNVSNVTNMNSMFNGASLFNQNLISWNVSNVTNMFQMFSKATLFNGNISSWDVTLVTDMGGMFDSCLAFNQNISSWKISNVTNFSNFMFGKSFTDYSTANLDAIYNTWSTITVVSNVTINFGTIKYSLVGQAGKNILTGAPNNWSIIDGGI
jgi:surface protein